MQNENFSLINSMMDENENDDLIMNYYDWDEDEEVTLNAPIRRTLSLISNIENDDENLNDNEIRFINECVKEIELKIKNDLGISLNYNINININSNVNSNVVICSFFTNNYEDDLLFNKRLKNIANIVKNNKNIDYSDLINIIENDFNFIKLKTIIKSCYYNNMENPRNIDTLYINPIIDAFKTEFVTFFM